MCLGPQYMAVSINNWLWLLAAKPIALVNVLPVLCIQDEVGQLVGLSVISTLARSAPRY